MMDDPLLTDRHDFLPYEIAKGARTRIAHVGQKFYDAPIEKILQPKDAAKAVSEAIGTDAPRPIQAVVGHERVWLRWVKPDGKGGLKPR